MYDILARRFASPIPSDSERDSGPGIRIISVVVPPRETMSSTRTDENERTKSRVSRLAPEREGKMFNLNSI